MIPPIIDSFCARPPIMSYLNLTPWPRVDHSSDRVLVAHTAQEITNNKPVILTYHDLGLNYVSNFQAFFNFPEFKVKNYENLNVALSGGHFAPLGHWDAIKAIKL